MSVILVVQPDSLQGKVLHDVARRIGAQLVIVDSTKRAVEAIGKQIPDLILLSALLPPREEHKLMAHLRTLEGAPHLQTLTLPQFRRAEEAKPRKSGFGFRKKQPAPVAAGCDPEAFAEEIVAQLARAKEVRTRPARPAKMTSSVAPEIIAVAPEIDAAEAEPIVELEQFVAAPLIPDPIAETPAPESPAIESSVFDRADSVFDLPTPDSDPLVEPVTSARATYEPTFAEPETYEPVNIEFTNLESANPEPANLESANFEPTSFESANIEPTNFEITNSAPRSETAISPITSSIDEDEIDQLVRQLGLDVRLVEIDQGAPSASVTSSEPDQSFDFSAALDRARLDAEVRRAADIAQLQAETEAIREAAIVEARAAAEREAREALAADLARVQAEAEAMREAAITEARAAAEREARETLNAELARVRSETEVTVADALNKVKVEAEEAERVRVEAERMRAEAQEAFAAELARVRAEVEQKLTLQLEAARAEAERMRTAEAAAVHEAYSRRSPTQVRARTPSIRLRAGAQGRRVGDKEGRGADYAARRRARACSRESRRAAARRARGNQGPDGGAA